MLCMIQKKSCQKMIDTKNTTMCGICWILCSLYYPNWTITILWCEHVTSPSCKKVFRTTEFTMYDVSQYAWTSARKYQESREIKIATHATASCFLPGSSKKKSAQHPRTLSFYQIPFRISLEIRILKQWRTISFQPSTFGPHGCDLPNTLTPDFCWRSLPWSCLYHGF